MADEKVRMLNINHKKTEWNNLPGYVFLVLILIIVSVFLNNIVDKQNKQIKVMMDLYKNNHQYDVIERIHTNNSTNSNSEVSSLGNDYNVPVEVLKEVKHFNEVMNQKQTDMLQMLVYVVAFFSIIATFFGYKTIKDIKDHAKDEMDKVGVFYAKSFDHLNNMSKLSEDFINSQYKHLESRVEPLISRVEILEQENRYFNNMFGRDGNIDPKKIFSEEVKNAKDKMSEINF